MADDIVKFTAGASYIPLGAGSTAVSVANEHAYTGLRIAISDALPPDDHAAFHTLAQRSQVSHTEIPAGFTLYVRSDSDTVQVDGHYRAFA